MFCHVLPAQELDTSRQQVWQTRIHEQKRTRAVEGTTIFTFTPILNHLIIIIINNFRPKIIKKFKTIITPF